MIATMAPSNPKGRGKGRPKGRKPSVSIQLRVPPELADQLEKLAARTRRTRNQEAILALEAHLEAADLWPPPARPKQEGE